MLLFIFSVLFYILALAFCIYAFASYFIYKGWDNPPPVPSFGKTKKAFVAAISKLLENSKTSLNVADLGCGSGSILIELVPKFPQHNFYGYEWDPLPFQIAKQRLKRYKNTQIIQADLMKMNLKHLDVAICYLARVPELGNRFKKALKPSAIVISEIFEIDGWKPQKIVESCLLGFKSKIFIYRVRDQKFRHH